MSVDTDSTWSAEEISDAGERVSHLDQNTTYYGHLAIYDFAVQFAQDADVLDVGCGAGYGSAYLAEHGARKVTGVDISEKAIAFCQQHFSDPRLEFHVQDAAGLNKFPEEAFDLIYSSNVLEHVQDVMGFMASAHRVLKPSGIMVIAVPPIPNLYAEYLNIINRYHVNIWSPRQWQHVLGLYFEEVTPYLHGLEQIGMGYRPEHISGERPITTDDFVFEACSVDAMYEVMTITGIFVAKTPRPASAIPAADAPTPFVDHSFTRLPGEVSPEVRERLIEYFEPDEETRALPSYSEPPEDMRLQQVEPEPPVDTRSLTQKTSDMLREEGPVATFQEALRYIRYRLGG